MLPSAWNMLERTNITPDATKLHDDDVQVLDADGDRRRDPARRYRISCAGARCSRRSPTTTISPPPSRRRPGRSLRTRSALPRAEVLSGHRRDREAERHHRHEHRLDQPQADAEAACADAPNGRLTV